ncbi:MAG: AAA family ATPase [Chloroflexi bacterium]|nr:AAA family ATPase [Chloroflexota bacterium]
MYLKHLSLRNFRNYQELELEVPPGLVVLHGENGQGKSNLLEAVYLLALTRSHRAESERELIRFEALSEMPYTRILGVARRSNQTEVSVQVDMALYAPDATPNAQHGAGRLRKSIRVNGIPRLASTAIGAIAAVSFAAEDIGLVTGAPAGRRHFLDVMASQVDRGYVRALQRYQKVLTQRNHLLRRIQEGSAKTGELAFWDLELCSQGAKILLSAGCDENIIGAISSHVPWNTEEYPRDTPIRKTLFAADELCGFIYAAALVRPERIRGMKPKSITKKMKQKSFAAAVSRDDIESGAELLGLPLAEHIANCIEAIATIADKINLLPPDGQVAQA